jgi:acyl-CoA thioesterase FadM
MKMDRRVGSPHIDTCASSLKWPAASGSGITLAVLSQLLRTVLVFLRAMRAPRIGLLDESAVWFRVLPGDLDVNVHLNNGRYLALMDLGRFELLMRSGLFRPMVRLRWRPLLGSAMVRYRRSLQPFQRFRLHSRLVCWDDRWFVFEQRFESRGQLYAVALARGLFRDRQGNIPPERVLALAGYQQPSPPTPDYVSRWVQADADAAAAIGERTGVR